MPQVPSLSSSAGWQFHSSSPLLKPRKPRPSSSLSMTLFPASLTKLKQPEENVHRPTTTPTLPLVFSSTQLCLPTITVNDCLRACLSLHHVLHSTASCLHKNITPAILLSFYYVKFSVSTGSFPLTYKRGVIFLMLKNY